MKKKILIITILFFLSLFFIFFQSNTIPKNLTHDENELARAAFSLENKPYTPFTSVADGHTTFYLYILLVSFKIFGVNQFALRLPNKIFGIFIISLFYGLMTYVFKTKKNLIIAFILSIVLLTSRWYLHFVRISFEMPFLLWLEIISLYTITLYQKQKKIIFLVISAIFAGAAFNSYQPGRIFFLLPLLILFLEKSNWKKYLIYLTVFFIIITPVFIYLIHHPQEDIRINQQFFLKNSHLSIKEKAVFLTSNVFSTALMFFWKGDINGQHNYPGKPALNPILFLFFILGLLISGYKRKKEDIIFLFYFFLAIAPTILTYPWENPNMLRTYTCLPALFYFIGQGILSIISISKFKKIQNYVLTIIMAVIILSSVYEMRTYFFYHPLVFKQSFDKPDYLKIIRINTTKTVNNK